MRIKNFCIFTNTLCSGGAEKQALLLFKVLNEKFNVWLVVYYGHQTEEKYLESLRNSDVKVILLKGNHLMRCLAFFRFLRNNKIDFIFSYLLTTNLLNGIIGNLAGVKYRIGGIRSSKLDNNKIFIQRSLQNHINYKTIYNNFRGYNIYSGKGFDSKKAVVIPNCFELRTELTVRKQKNFITVLSVGRFHKAKDYETAIKAVSKIKYKNFKYQIIGYGSLEKDIRNWIIEYSAQDCIELIINPDNINEYYRKADIYLQTSIFEGLSNTVLEAMSFYLPLVLTDVGDNDRLVVNSENGYLCDIGDIEQICQKLELLVNDYDKRIEFGLNSYQILKENYSFEKFQNNYFNFIRELEKEVK